MTPGRDDFNEASTARGREEALLAMNFVIADGALETPKNGGGTGAMGGIFDSAASTLISSAGCRLSTRTLMLLAATTHRVLSLVLPALTRFGASLTSVLLYRTSRADSVSSAARLSPGLARHCVRLATDDRGDVAPAKFPALQLLRRRRGLISSMASSALVCVISARSFCFVYQLIPEYLRTSCHFPAFLFRRSFFARRRPLLALLLSAHT